MRNERGQSLTVADNHFGNADLTGSFHHFAQERIGAPAVFQRLEIIGRFIVKRADIGGIDEVHDLYRLRGLDVGVAKVFVA